MDKIKAIRAATARRRYRVKDLVSSKVLTAMIKEAGKN